MEEDILRRAGREGPHVGQSVTSTECKACLGRWGLRHERGGFHLLIGFEDHVSFCSHSEEELNGGWWIGSGFEHFRTVESVRKLRGPCSVGREHFVLHVWEKSARRPNWGSRYCGRLWNWALE
jgi:hypothetical protein